MSTTHPLPAQPIRLFHHPLLGHLHRVELFLSLLGLPFDKVPVDFLGQPFLVGAAPTLADVSLYTYTAHAPEGGVPLDAYPNVRAWLARIEALPGFIGMQRSPAAEPLAVV